MHHSSLKGRNFIVTGGTQGLGEGIADRLSQLEVGGITICGRNLQNGERVSKRLTTDRTKCVFVEADLQHEEACRNVVRTAIEAFGTIHGLVNAAGVVEQGTIEDTPVSAWDFIMAVNVRAPFILMQEVVRHMKQRGTHGSIVNMISDTYHGGQDYLTAYSASKGAFATLTKNVANAVRFDRIRVNGVCLGWMYTPHEHQVQLGMGKPENWLEEVEKEQPFGRLLRPADLGHIAAFLLSDEAMMMTGALIDYDQKVIGAKE